MKKIRQWLEETAWALGPDLVLLAVFSLLLAVCMVAFHGSFSILHASTIMPCVGMLVLLAASFVPRWRGILHDDPGVRREVRRVAWATTRDWFPLVLILLVYGNFHDLTHLIHPETVDATLQRADQAVFGFQPALVMQAITRPWLTEYMTFAYALFFVFPAILLVRLYARGDLLAFRELSLALSLCFYLGLVGYLTVPAIGPRYTMDFDVPLTGYWMTDACARMWLAIEKVQTDCFPSLHTAVSTISLVYFARLRAWRFGRAILVLVTPLVISLWMSTIYLRYHYGVDVLAGWALAALCVTVAPAVVQTNYRKRDARSLAALPSP